MAAQRQGQTQDMSTPVSDGRPKYSASSAGAENLPSLQQPSLNDLCTIAADIKDTMSAVISDLCLDIQALTGRVHEVEKVTAQEGTAIDQVSHRVNTHSSNERSSAPCRRPRPQR